MSVTCVVKLFHLNSKCFVSKLEVWWQCQSNYLWTARSRLHTCLLYTRLSGLFSLYKVKTIWELSWVLHSKCFCECLLFAKWFVIRPSTSRASYGKSYKKLFGATVIQTAAPANQHIKKTSEIRNTVAVCSSVVLHIHTEVLGILTVQVRNFNQQLRKFNYVHIYRLE